MKNRPDHINYRVMLKIYKAFGRFYKKYWKMAVGAYLALVVSIAIALLLPWPLKLILDHVILQVPLPPQAAFLSSWFGSAPLQLLAALVLGFVCLRLLDSFFSYLHKVGMLSMGENLLTDIREHLFAHLQRLSLSFHGKARTGDLIYRLTRDVEDLRIILINFPQYTAYRLLTIISLGVVMLTLEWRLALVAFTVLPFLYYFQRRFGHKLQGATRRRKTKESEVASLISENVTAMALVQAYGREDLQRARFESENRESLASEITALRLSKSFKRVSEVLMAAGACGVVYYGGTLALQGDILPGTLVLFASYLKGLYKPIEKFTSMFLSLARAQVAGERLLELVNSAMVMADDPGARPAAPLQGRVEFQNVSFSYQPGLPTLKDITFTIEPGETVALVGHSGAGKSTLVSLLLRFYDPQQGEIRLDGYPLRQFTLQSLRRQITVVMQQARLFNKTVRENIAFGKAGATEEEIVRAATLARAHDFIMQMPGGYDAKISEGGKNLSGGQRQRINIARAIIRDTPILILDEPAAALDAKTEAEIHQALAALTRGKTTFIIAHKLSTIANADKILVLEQGNLVGVGKHQQLLQSCPAYRELYQLQFGWAESAGEEELEEPLELEEEEALRGEFGDE